MPDTLSIWNGALAACGERALASLTENREPRYVIEDVWNREFIRECLEEAMWKFATRSSKLSYSPSVTPAFGYQYGYEKPGDWLKTVAVCQDEFYKVPLLSYTTEQGYIYTELDEIYVKYVSNDVEWGMDLSLWPRSFTRYMEHYLGSLIMPRLNHSESKQNELKRLVKQFRVEAKQADAIELPTKFPPAGSWSTARRSGSSGRYDRGSRSTLGVWSGS